jgi:hypothetical protein
MSFEIVEIATQEVVRTIASTKRGRQRERVLAGLLENLDREHYFIRDLVEVDEELDAALERARLANAKPQRRSRPNQAFV